MRERPGRIVTFYSYKGGTGRSMALANIAWVLASGGKRVLVLDWDLEAPGLQRYFRPFLIDKDLTSSGGIVDFITDFVLEAVTPLDDDEEVAEDWYVEKADILRYAVSLNWKDFPKGGGIDFVSAGRQGPDYAARFAAINWQDFYDRLGGGAFLEAAREKMRANYDYVLIDSRTGVSDTSGICTIQMPDMLVVCFTFNNQSIEGASAVTRSASEQHELNERRTDGFRVVPVPTRVELTESEKLERRKSFARWRFQDYVEHIPVSERQAFWASVEVPYIPYFAYEELLAPFKEEASDPKSCLHAFVCIARHITDNAVSEYNSLLSPAQREAVLKEFASTPLSAAVTEQAGAGGAADDGNKSLNVETRIERHLRLVETTFAALDEAEREAARRMWTRLVRVPRLGEGVEVTKVRVPLKDLGDDVRIADKFAGAGLLVRGREGGDAGVETVEAASDELVRNWKRLTEWIERDRDFLLWRQQLRAAIASWKESAREVWELLNGRALEEAQKRFAERPGDLSEDETDYISTSMQERAKQRRRNIRWLMAGAAAVLASILLTVGAKYYVQRSDYSETAKAITDKSDSLIKASANAKGADKINFLQRGLLLAVEAERLYPSSRSENILKENLPLLPRRVAVSNADDSVRRVALAADGKTLMAVTERPPRLAAQDPAPQRGDRAAQVQNAATGDVIAKFPFNSDMGVYDLSPNGKYLAVSSAASESNPAQNGQKFSVNVLDVAQNRQVASLTPTGTVRALVFSPNEKYLVTGGDDLVTNMLDLNSGSNAAFNNSRRVVSIAFSPDSKFFATADGNAGVHVREISNEGAPSRALLATNFILDGTAYSFALSPEGRYLAAVSYTGTAFTIWEVKSGKMLSKYEHGDTIQALAFSPDGKYLIVGGDHGKICAWDVSAAVLGTPKYQSIDGGLDVYKVAFSPDGKYLTAVGNGNVVRLWAVDEEFKEVGLLIHDGNVNDIAFSADGKFVATAGSDSRVRVWYMNRPLGADLSSDEPCARLTRNLTIEEWESNMPASVPYRRTCTELTQSSK